ncbi:hypothetical protein LRP67_03955 [Nocardioides sp. cx-169]|uniref:hypothetical protein n=1 Tax=Nocardioides sp. cx-169 TaxID=2899080 RepID=UPI001E44E2B5|nr:hypothetical protein [Nocardioides sp. cx-169]MCD4533233.1 hypothetical protein [Nocardioides sp. cx-169]
MQTLLPALTALAAVALLAGGCSGEGEPGATPSPPPPSASEHAGADEPSLRAGLVRLWVGDDATAEDTETGECFADALIEASTPQQLAGAGILDGSHTVVAELPVLDRAGAELWVDAQLACTDLVAESTRAQVAATKGKVDRTAYEACLRDALTEQQLREAAEEAVMGNLAGDAVSAFSAAQLTCVQQALPPD